MGSARRDSVDSLMRDLKEGQWVALTGVVGWVFVASLLWALEEMQPCNGCEFNEGTEEGQFGVNLMGKLEKMQLGVS